MAMHDYHQKITDFIRDNFKPATYNTSNFNRTTDGLLRFLNNAYPDNCISDYELVEILEELGHVIQTYPEDLHKLDEDGEVVAIEKVLRIGWCLRSEYNLETEEFEQVNKRKKKR